MSDDQKLAGKLATLSALYPAQQRQTLIPGVQPPAPAPSRPPARRGRGRRAHFRIEAPIGQKFNGAKFASVVIGDGLVTVRPRRRRRVYELPLWVVAQWVIERVVRAEYSERKKRRGGRAK